MKKEYWLCLLVLLTVAGCKDECDDYSNYYRIDDVVKPYLFKEGTYWIYQNSVTGEVDSEYVSRVENDIDTSVYIKYTCGVNYSVHEGIKMTHKNTEHPDDSLVWFSWGGIVSPALGVNKNGTNNMILFLENKNTNYTGGCFSYKGYSDKLSINSSAFYSVDCFSQKSDSAECSSIFDYTTDFYFAPHFGLIKKVEYATPNGTQEWNLIRWKIVQ